MKNVSSSSVLTRCSGRAQLCPCCQQPSAAAAAAITPLTSPHLVRHYGTSSPGEENQRQQTAARHRRCNSPGCAVPFAHCFGPEPGSLQVGVPCFSRQVHQTPGEAGVSHQAAALSSSSHPANSSEPFVSALSQNGRILVRSIIR